MALKRAVQQSTSFRLKLQTASVVSPKTVQLRWEDCDTPSTFHAPWLWHQCPSFIHESGQRLLRATAMPTDLAVSRVEHDGDDVVIDWENGHQSVFPSAYLHTHRYSHLKQPTRRQTAAYPSTATGLDIPGDDVASLSSFDCEAWMSSDSVLWEALHQLALNGAVLLTGTPCDSNSVVEIAERISNVQPTIYGKTFEVASQVNPINVAYSSIGLDLHMDLAYYESPPGLQLLHCMQFDDGVVGGDSQLMDGFRAAEHVFNTRPDLFETLCSVPHTLQKIHKERENPVHMVYRRPHVSTDFYGRLNGFFWAPPFEGPLHVPPELVEPYFEAYIALGKAMDEAAEEHLLEFKLSEGDTVIFNNRRMLHGRSAFASSNEAHRRVLSGCYVNIDEFLSRYMHLGSRFGKRLGRASVGNQVTA